MSSNPLPPADLSKLKNILGGAKAIMNKVDGGTYEKGNVNLDTSVTSDQLIEGNNNPQIREPNKTNVAPQIVGGKAQYRNINTSKMPDFIKEAMINSPIPQINGLNHTFNLDDVTDLVDKPQTKQPLIEQKQSNNDTFTVSETALRGIIKDVVKEELLTFMSETFAKRLSEQTIKKTINTLIKEGKIKTKRKINS